MVANLLVLFSFAFLVQQMLPSLREMEWNRVVSNPLPFFLGFLLQTVALLTQFLLWFGLLRSVSKDFSFALCFRQYTIALLSRYLPAGKLAQAASLAVLTEKAEHRALSVSAMVLCSVASIACGVFFSLPYFVDTRHLVVWELVLFTSFFFFGPFLIRSFLKKYKWAELLSFKMVSLTTIGSAVGWMLETTAAVYILKGFGIENAFSFFPLVLGSFAISSLAGYAAFFIPAGLGVRDVAIALTLGKGLPASASAFLAVGIRVFLTISELVFALPLLFMRFRARCAPAVSFASTDSSDR